MRSQSRKWRRRHQRGAALVEAAVVIPSFVLLLGGMLFLHHVLREQQRVMKQTRNDAWTFAMKSCTGNGVGVPTPPFSSTMPGAPGSDNLSDHLDKATASKSSSVSVTSDSGFNFSQSVSAHTVVFCNNQTSPGDIPGVVKWLIQNFQSLKGGA
jgi:hypothetical protein